MFEFALFLSNSASVPEFQTNRIPWTTDEERF